MKIFRLTICILLCSLSQAFAQIPATPPPPAGGSVRLERLTMFYETFEAGFAYVTHCGDMKSFLIAKPFYMSNAQVTVAALGDEIKKQNPESDIEKIHATILGRSKQIQTAFDKFYQSPNACASKSALTAKAHIDQFSEIVPAQTTAFVNDIENR